MITLTERAKDCLWGIMPEWEVMRLDGVGATTNGSEPALAVYSGDPEAGDEPVEYRGEPLLWVSIAVSAAFEGCVVDLAETPEGIGFGIGPP